MSEFLNFMAALTPLFLGALAWLALMSAVP
jgi:hypothetical protein